MSSPSSSCAVCFAEFNQEHAYTLSGCGCTHHRPCLLENISFHLNSGQIHVSCLVCGAPLLDSDVRELLNEKTELGVSMLARLNRLRLQKADSSIRFCPDCSNPTTGGSLSSSSLTCSSCGKIFCFMHSTAHAPGPAACLEYTKAQASSPDTLLSLETIRKNSRPCPNAQCGTQLERAGGCNSMVCTNCGITFCWLCGKQISEDSL